LGMGAVHRSEAWEKFGRKIFLLALSREGGIWEDLLTDSNGQYAELQSGRYFLQPGWEAYATPFKHPVLAPGSSERFAESWGVLRRREDLREDGPSPVARPLAAPEGFDWDGAYGLYVRGSQHFAMGDDLAEAERLLNASLALAPDFAPALDALAAIEMRRGDYAAVHGLCRRALAVSTVDEDANYLDGYAYFAEGDDVSARDRLGMATFGTKNRSAAYALIARTFLRSGESEKALKAAAKSLASNAWNLDALLVKAIVDREAAKGILEQYPLFHAVRRELEGDSFREFVRNENPDETYVEIGSWYEESGLFDRAAEMYSFAHESLIAMIRLAYLKRDVSMLSAASGLPVDGVAPFRRETLPALRWAVENSGDWRWRYCLAVLLASFAKDAEAVKLLDSCADEPDSAVFYLFRSLFRSGAEKYRDLVLAQSHGDSWRVGRQMCDYFAAGGDLARYLSVAAGYVKKYPLCNPLQLAYADALEKNGRYDECLSFLRGVTILPSEFSGGATAIWQRAQKALGMEPTWPENLGQGEPY
ncbi:MAG: DUF5107 domain-containing protein, partial [Kiritimatiellae bacterium]|nr:DUF5107 domain-containing protein [Kiritimatiellia bacterium]